MQIYTHNIKPLEVLMQSLQLSLKMLLAATVTLSLYIMMYQLINTDDIPEKPVKHERIIDFIMPKTDISVFEEAELIKPVPPLATPERLSELIELEPSNNRIPMQTSIKWQEQGKLLLKPSRSEAIPIFRVDAVYPNRPLMKGIEGFVDLIFDVDEIGATKNIRVISADPPRTFDRAASKAVSKWKYEPKVIDGEGVYQSGLTTRIRFAIKD